jgi:hypothetical protein
MKRISFVSDDSKCISFAYNNANVIPFLNAFVHNFKLADTSNHSFFEPIPRFDAVHTLRDLQIKCTMKINLEHSGALSQIFHYSSSNRDIQTVFNDQLYKLQFPDSPIDRVPNRHYSWFQSRERVSETFYHSTGDLIKLISSLSSLLTDGNRRRVIFEPQLDLFFRDISYPELMIAANQLFRHAMSLNDFDIADYIIQEEMTIVDLQAKREAKNTDVPYGTIVSKYYPFQKRFDVINDKIRKELGRSIYNIAVEMKDLLTRFMRNDVPYIYFVNNSKQEQEWIQQRDSLATFVLEHGTEKDIAFLKTLHLKIGLKRSIFQKLRLK